MKAGKSEYPAPPVPRANNARKQAFATAAEAAAELLAGPDASLEQVSDLGQALRAQEELADFGAALGTEDKDDRAWTFWEQFCSQYGWAPVLTNESVAGKQSEVARRLGLFMLWVYPRLHGKYGRRYAKPQTAMDYALAIIRIFNRRHVAMPKAKAFAAELRGLQRAFRNVYGAVTLAPKRRQPMLNEMRRVIQALAEGTPLAGRATWSPRTRRIDAKLLLTLAVLWRTGHRIGEVCQGRDPSEISYLTRKDLTFRIGGVILVDPTREQLLLMRDGDICLLAPCPSKPDMTGEEHCPFPSVIPHDGTATCAAALLVAQELAEPCRGDDRELTPLIADVKGRPYTYSVLNRQLYLLVRALFGENIAKDLSWHSVRIGLACALHAAGCPDPLIQLICRWTCPNSLRLYRRIGISEHVHWTTRAQDVSFEATQTANLPTLDNELRSAELMGYDMDRALHVVEAGKERQLPPAPAARSDGNAPLACTPARVLPPPRDPARHSVGDYAVIDKSEWPSARCSELDGQGWLVQITSTWARGAQGRVRFIDARTRDGRRFGEVDIVFSALRPLPPELTGDDA